MNSSDEEQVFISYSRRNEYFAKQLDCDLYRLGLKPWRDKRDIPVHAKWLENIVENIRKSQRFLLLLSPDSAKSKNVKDEWEIAHNTVPADRIAIISLAKLTAECQSDPEAAWAAELEGQYQRICFLGDYWSDDTDEAGFRRLTAWLGREPIASSISMIRQNSFSVKDMVTEFQRNPGRTWPVSQGSDRLSFLSIPLAPSAYSTSWLVAERSAQSWADSDLLVIFQFTARSDRNAVDDVLRFWSRGGIADLSDDTPDLLLLEGPNKNREYKIDDNAEYVWADCIEHCVDMIEALKFRRTLHFFMHAPQALTFSVATELRQLGKSRIYHLPSESGVKSQTYRSIYRTST